MIVVVYVVVVVMTVAITAPASTHHPAVVLSPVFTGRIVVSQRGRGG
jgi:hypothetical protein